MVNIDDEEENNNNYKAKQGQKVLANSFTSNEVAEVPATESAIGDLQLLQKRFWVEVANEVLDNVGEDPTRLVGCFRHFGN